MPDRQRDREDHEETPQASETDPPRWVKAIVFAAVVFAVAFIAMHILGGFGKHGRSTVGPANASEHAWHR